MIGGDDEAVGRLQSPSSRRSRPGVDAAGRTPGRDGDPAPEEQGWLHCGPNGAGHFVKMVHNGIEYGLMQAYAEGLNVLKHANIGKHAQETDAETTPLRDPDHYKYELDVAGDRGALAPRLGRRVVAARPDRAGAARVAEPRRLRRPRQRLGRGPLDGAGRGRGGRAGAGARGLALRPLRLARRGRLGRSRPLGDAEGLRGPPGEEPRAMTETAEPQQQENPLLEGLAAPAHARSVRARDLRRLGRPDPAQALPRALLACAPAAAAREVRRRRRRPQRGDRRRVPRADEGRRPGVRPRRVQGGRLELARRRDALRRDRLRRRGRREPSRCRC